MNKPFDEEAGPWVGPVFTAHSTRADIDAAVEMWARWALDNFAATLADDPDLTPRARAALLVQVEPLVRARTRDAFVSGWMRLRAEAALLDTDEDGAVH